MRSNKPRLLISKQDDFNALFGRYARIHLANAGRPYGPQRDIMVVPGERYCPGATAK
jgi:hypothetical protein